jgi:hypothetical protein
MNLENEEYKLKKKCMKIIKNNDVDEAINKISKLKFMGNELGRSKAVNVCKLYIRNFVDICDKPDNFNYIKELNKKCNHLK